MTCVWSAKMGKYQPMTSVWSAKMEKTYDLCMVCQNGKVPTYGYHTENLWLTNMFENNVRPRRAPAYASVLYRPTTVFEEYVFNSIQCSMYGAGALG